jgi:DNA-directed RNA polymerase specialized sigma24 family protein
VSQQDVFTHAQIAQVAQRLVQHYAWQGVAEQWIVERVTQRLASAAPAGALPDLARWCEQAASEAIYQACAPAPWATAAPAVQARLVAGYGDLGNYLTHIARRLPAPVAGWEPDDLVQETLAIVHKQYGDCNNPATFLAWAAQIMRRQGLGNWRAGQREVPEAALFPPDEEGRRPPTATRPDPLANALGDQELLRILHDCLDDDEERTLALCYTFGLKRRELGILFDRPLVYFDELGRKVKRKLRRCALFRALFAPSPASAPGRGTR